MINTGRFPSESSAHDQFWSCHLIINRNLSDDPKRIPDFIDADFFCCLFYSIFKYAPSTKTCICFPYYTSFGKILGISAFINLSVHADTCTDMRGYASMCANVRTHACRVLPLMCPFLQYVSS